MILCLYIYMFICLSCREEVVIKRKKRKHKKGIFWDFIAFWTPVFVCIWCSIVCRLSFTLNLIFFFEGKLPKNYNPEVDPDPERWLPRWERSTYKHKKSKRGNTGVGKSFVFTHCFYRHLLFKHLLFDFYIVFCVKLQINIIGLF